MALTRYAPLQNIIFLAFKSTPACSAGTYSAAGAASCTACPSGSTSAAGASTCTCNAGFGQSGTGATLVCTGNVPLQKENIFAEGCQADGHGVRARPTPPYTPCSVPCWPDQHCRRRMHEYVSG